MLNIPLCMFWIRAWRRNIFSCLPTGNSRRICKKQNTTCGGRWPWTHRLNYRRHRLRPSIFSVSWIMYLYYNLFGIFNKLNFLKPPKNKMHFTVFILWYYFTVFTNWMTFWLFYHGCFLASLKCLFMSFFWWFWRFYFNFGKKQRKRFFSTP